MQKINPINYVLLIFGLSGASLAYSATPESIAAALNFCQERFNTSDKDECQKLIENKLLNNIQQSFDYLFTNNFANPTAPEELAKFEEMNEENNIFSKHLQVLRNDQLTPEMTFECSMKLFTRTMERCNKQADATDLSSCIVNGWLDDLRMMVNVPDAIKISKSSASIRFFDIIAAYSQAGIEGEIQRLEKAPSLAGQAPLPINALKELLEAVKATRAKFATVVPPFQLPKAPVTTEEAVVATTIILAQHLDNAEAPGAATDQPQIVEDGESKEIHD